MEFNPFVDFDRRVFAREYPMKGPGRPKKSDWGADEKDIYEMLSKTKEGRRSLSGGGIWGIYNIKGTTGEGNYPEGPPDHFRDSLTLGPRTDDATAEVLNPVRSRGPGATTEYRRMTRALNRSADHALANERVGIAWVGNMRGRARDPELLLDPDNREFTDHQTMHLAGSSARVLAGLNKEQGFTFAEQGSTTEKKEIKAFATEGIRKSYWDSDKGPKALPDECVETVSLTEQGPIFKSTGLPGCP